LELSEGGAVSGPDVYGHKYNHRDEDCVSLADILRDWNCQEILITDQHMPWRHRNDTYGEPYSQNAIGWQMRGIGNRYMEFLSKYHEQRRDTRCEKIS
jgi:hypothetical protein